MWLVNILSFLMVDTKKKNIRKEGKIKGFIHTNKMASSNFMFFSFKSILLSAKKKQYYLIGNILFSVFFENHFLDKN